MKAETRSTCCYCGTGCGVVIESEGGRITGVRGDETHPANFGRLCAKGAALADSARLDCRLLHPQSRNARGEARRRVGWDEALDHAARRFADTIRAHGPDSVAFYLSGQLLTEDYYVFNKLAKGLIGTNNLDTNSRLCMSSAVAGYKQTLGADAPPCAYEDIDHAECILIAGANPAVAHPIVYRRIEDARAANPNLRVIVVDPRRSESCAIADLHLALKPGSDIALYNAMLHVLLKEKLIDRDYIAAHTEGFDALEKLVERYAPAMAAELTGLDAEAIALAARWFGGAKTALSLYCQGLNQSWHGTHNNAALIHLHLATGSIGKPGCGPFSLTGQPNAMGGREVGGLANLLPAHRDLGDPAHRAETARFWGVPYVPPKPGKPAVALFRALKSGEIKALWIACTNPAQSMPDVAGVRAALEAAEFVVLQEAYADTDTAQYADLLLPATSWGEKEGTVTNSERRISRVRAAVPPPGEARHDWRIALDFARRLGAELGNPLTERLFPYATPEAIHAEHRASTRGRDLDISGLSYALLETAGAQQWPYPEGARAGQVRLYADGVFPTPSGRARFVPVEHRPTAEPTDPARPISLLSGRLLEQWHGMSRTGTVPRLFNGEDEPLLKMNPDDLRQRGLDAGALAQVSNGRGSIVVRVEADEGLAHGRAWLPMHWGERFMNGYGANALTPAATDPYSFQPELKHAAVAVEKAELPWSLVVLRRGDEASADDSALALLARVRPLLKRFPYATAGLYGRGAPLVVLRAAAAAAPPAGLLAEIDALFGLDAATGAVYVDPRRGIDKKVLARDGKLLGVRLAGETLAAGWLKDAMAAGTLDASLIRFALAPSALPPQQAPARSPIVCRCAGVGEAQIRAALAGGASLAAVQDTLKCGTYCGGCLPELRKMAAATAATVA
ncbi:MAG: molybdopterin-dependent oxidoreductase [Rhodocyclaceae bacterium]|nr:molybdopterin-dependent oxidoreductase [Rhodocyclaceae bacterium]